MKQEIDLKKPIMFYDDRGKHSDVFCNKILYSDGLICLCECSFEYKNIEINENIYILFNIKTCAVLTENFSCYYAKNIDISNNEINDIIKRHFHVFSKEDWENNIKNEFPYSEIPFIIKDVLQTLKNKI
jgi:hypothetical protein